MAAFPMSNDPRAPLHLNMLPFGPGSGASTVSSDPWQKHERQERCEPGDAQPRSARATSALKRVKLMFMRAHTSPQEDDDFVVDKIAKASSQIAALRHRLLQRPSLRRTAQGGPSCASIAASFCETNLADEVGTQACGWNTLTPSRMMLHNTATSEEITDYTSSNFALHGENCPAYHERSSSQIQERQRRFSNKEYEPDGKNLADRDNMSNISGDAEKRICWSKRRRSNGGNSLQGSGESNHEVVPRLRRLSQIASSMFSGW
jgi:hypothetical protein